MTSSHLRGARFLPLDDIVYVFSPGRINIMSENHTGNSNTTKSSIFSDEWSKYELQHGGKGKVSGLIPFTVTRNPLTSKQGNAYPHSNGWISKNNNSTQDQLESGLDRIKYSSCMSNKKPTFRIPDEEADTLNEEQRLVVESVLSGYSTFFTGPAGSGKSHVLEHILRLNESGAAGPKRNIVVTATTGLAACNIGGVTIHSFAGVGTGEESLPNMIARVTGNEYAKQRWRECDILVIDEISMMPAQFLDKLSSVASRARNNRRLFGGIQLVVCGDFFQLPPVNIEKNQFAFEAEVWPKVISTSICLTNVFRQNKDMTLVKILNEARLGQLSDESISILYRHSQRSSLPKSASMKQGDLSPETQPTLIECKNAVVDRLNKDELAKIEGDVVVYKALDKCINSVYEGQLKSCQAPETLELKQGATVMLLKNIDLTNGLVNGIRGVIIGFQKAPLPNDICREFKNKELPVVRFESIKHNSASEEIPPKIVEPADWSNKIGDQEVSSRCQIPLRLGYALTVHKSQGMTIPDLVVNLSDTFEYGQAYVALSRATCLDKLVLKGFNERNFRAHPKVKDFYRILENIQPGAIALSEKPTIKCNDMDMSSTMTSKRNADDSLTDAQRRRIDENRKRALLLRQERLRESDGCSGVTIK